jgi:hypothetical protein
VDRYLPEKSARVGGLRKRGWIRDFLRQNTRPLVGNEYKGLKGRYNLCSTSLMKVRISHPCNIFRSGNVLKKGSIKKEVEMNRTNRFVSILAIIALTWLVIWRIPLNSSTAQESSVAKQMLGSRAKLVVETNTVTFPNNRVGRLISIPALENDVKVIVELPSGAACLQVMAEGDLVSDSDIIPIEEVVWQVSGDGFMGGTLSKKTAQKAGSWIRGGVAEGHFRFFLNDVWNYPEGEYRATLTFTLTAP